MCSYVSLAGVVNVLPGCARARAKVDGYVDPFEAFDKMCREEANKVVAAHASSCRVVVVCLGLQTHHSSLVASSFAVRVDCRVVVWS